MKKDNRTLVEIAQALTPMQWNIRTSAGGALLGLLCGAAICFAPDIETFGSYKLIAVACAMLLLPRVLEQQFQRDLAKGRLAMLIAFALVLVISIIYHLATGKM